ncbi:cell division control protein 6 homolog [Ctenocephalides felis]|uniref:cell division control protein 6 homolog n=1 Tax=Ctenocephalides felis TaxID=7515 RepID=UPI000E6E3053|nr:cell division control protein 6 homolog [Ctenocephalides felis]
MSVACSPPKIRRTGQHVNSASSLSPTNKLLQNLTLDIQNGNEKNDELDGRLQIARQALHSTAPINLPGREKELQELENIINTSLKKETSTSLYVSGPPGTGKTACLTNIIQKYKNKLSIVYANCTGIKNSKTIFERIATELKLKCKSTEKDYKCAIETYIQSKHKMILLILDEIDQLDSRKQSILYTIFEWPSYASSKLILIGIANALDLTDRILPRLQSKCELKPQLMHFAPYSKNQIIEIYKQRLESSGVTDVFSPMAVQLLAGKVAAVSGDARRALDIGRRVIELTEQQTCVEKENLHKQPAVGVELGQVVSVLKNVYSTPQSLNDKTEENEQTELPIQQCILICSLLLILKKSSNRDVTIGRLHDIYKRVCTKQNIMAVDQTEFVGLCSLVDSRGIIRISGKKEPRLQKVTLQWDEEEISSIFHDKQLMASIIADISCLK